MKLRWRMSHHVLLTVLVNIAEFADAVPPYLNDLWRRPSKNNLPYKCIKSITKVLLGSSQVEINSVKEELS